MERDLDTLITLAKQGDDEAFVDLVEQYKPLVESMSKAYKKKCASEMYSEEDFVQESTLALYSAVKTYKEKQDVTFGLYAKICIRNRLVSLLRTASKKREKTERQKVEQNEPVYRLIESEKAKELEKRIQSKLSAFEWSVFCLYIQKKSYFEIAEAVGKSTKSVDNAIYRIKTKLKEFM